MFIKTLERTCREEHEGQLCQKLLPEVTLGLMHHLCSKVSNRQLGLGQSRPPPQGHVGCVLLLLATMAPPGAVIFRKRPVSK